MKICLLLFTLFALSNAKLERFNDLELDDKLEKLNEKKNNEYGFFNRKLDTIKNRTHFEFTSMESNRLFKKNVGFKFHYSDGGIELNFNANKNSSEYTRLVFKKIMYNDETLYEFAKTEFDDMNCVSLSEHKTCVLSTKDSFLEVRADFNTQIYTKTFNNRTQRYFPTDIKVTVMFNTSLYNFNQNDSFVLVSKIKTDNKHYFNNKETSENEDNFHGNLTYMSFENYALGDDQIEYPVMMLENTDMRRHSDLSEDDDDEREYYFNFNFTNTTNTLTWDPTFGATSAFADASDLTPSSASISKLNLYVSCALLFIINLI